MRCSPAVVLRPREHHGPGCQIIWMFHRLGFNPFFLPCLLYLLALTSVSCDTNKFETGPLSAVEVAPGDDIQIRSMAVLSGTGALGIPSQRGVMIALADYGPIQVRNVSMGAGLVMVGPSTTSPSLTSDLNGTSGSNHHPGYYRAAHNDLCQAQAVATFAYNERRLRRVAVIHEGDPYKSGPTGAFTAAFEEIGGSVAAVAINKGGTDMAPHPHPKCLRRTGRAVLSALPRQTRKYSPPNRPTRGT